MSLSLSGKTVVITGASRGIGLGIARCFAEAGARLHLIADDHAVTERANELGASGAKADIVFLDLASLNYVPLHDPVNQIVHAEDGTGVDSVMVGGRLVVDGRRLTTIDVNRVAAQAASAVERLRAANAPLRQLSDRLAAAVGTFCGSLAAQPYRVERHIAPDPRS